jgi:hypothetical protein
VSRTSLTLAASGAALLLLGAWLSESHGLRAPWTGVLVVSALVAYLAAGAAAPTWRIALAASLTLLMGFVVVVVSHELLSSEPQPEPVEFEGRAILLPSIVVLPALLVTIGYFGRWAARGIRGTSRSSG